MGLLIGFRVVIPGHPFVFDDIKNMIMRVGLWEIPTLVWVHRFVILDSMNVRIRHVHAEMKILLREAVLQRLEALPGLLQVSL